jgi:hypothetical protein
MNKALPWLIVIAIFVGEGIVIYFLWKKNSADAAVTNQLNENVKKSLTYDSIKSANESILLTKIVELKQQLQIKKDEQHRENILLRKNNEALQHRVDDIDITDRPDF